MEWYPKQSHNGPIMHRLLGSQQKVTNKSWKLESADRKIWYFSKFGSLVSRLTKAKRVAQEIERPIIVFIARDTTFAETREANEDALVSYFIFILHISSHSSCARVVYEKSSVSWRSLTGFMSRFSSSLIDFIVRCFHGLFIVTFRFTKFARNLERHTELRRLWSKAQFGGI